MKTYAVIMSILVVCAELGVLSMAWNIGVTRGSSTLLAVGIAGAIMLVFNALFLSPVIVWGIFRKKRGTQQVQVDDASGVADRREEEAEKDLEAPNLGDYLLLVFFLCLFVGGAFACAYCLCQDLSEFLPSLLFVVPVKIMLLIGTLVGLFLSGCAAYSLVTSLTRQKGATADQVHTENPVESTETHPSDAEVDQSKDDQPSEEPTEE